MKKVLVIDDSDANLYLIQTIFEDDEDIDVVIESQSSNAIRIIKEKMPDVLVLDLMMPQIDGFELLHQIKADPKMSKMQIVVISAYLNDETIDRIEQFGVKNYLSKPIDLDQTETKILKLLKTQ